MEPVKTHSAVRLDAMQEADFAVLAQLGETIWREHYASIISHAQIDYMLNNRYSAENLRQYLGAEDRWLDIVKLTDQPIGYCSCALTAQSGVMKLEQFYLLAKFRGKGLGSLMLRHVEERARRLGCNTITLQVNKHNTTPIAIYRKAGFSVQEEAVFDIGHGFVMDDFVMKKSFNCI